MVTKPSAALEPGAASPPPRRVLWLVKGLGLGGAEQLVASSVPLLDSERFRGEVAYVNKRDSALALSLANAGVRVRCLNPGSAHDPRWVVRLLCLLWRQRYDVVHTHSPLSAATARLVARCLPPARRPVFVHTEHNLWPSYRGLTRAAHAATFRWNAAALAVSDAVRDSIDPRQTRGVHLQTLLHGVVLAGEPGSGARRAARQRFGVSDDDWVVGTVGNLSPKKDQATMLRALRLLRDRSVPVTLVVIGDGPLGDELKAEARRLRVDTMVRWLGRRHDVLDLLPGFDVFTLSSLFEGLPLSLLEAMGQSLPVVSTAVGGVPEVIDDGTSGLLVAPGDATALANAWDQIRRDHELRAALASAAQVRSRDFDLKAAVQEMEHVYDSVLGLT